MRQIKEIIRLKELNKLSNRKIATICRVSPTTVSSQIEKFEQSGLNYESLKEKSDEEIFSMLNPSNAKKVKSRRKVMPDMNYIHKELKRKGVTLQLLWEEYKQEHPDGYGRSQFSYHYNKWKKQLNPVMRLNHKNGEKVFVDFSGFRPKIYNCSTMKEETVELFIGVMGASSYTFAYAVANQKIENWIRCHVEMFKFFGGVSECIIPDNLKSGVTQACYYDPEINPTYADMAEHYQVVVIPARVRKPRDKAKVENGVLNVQRRILASLRDRKFFSISELNAAISKELEKFNNKPMQHLCKSRKELFEELDKPALKGLPETEFKLFKWKKSRVGIDYHVNLDNVYYSVPYKYIHKEVLVRYNEKIVDIFYNNRKISSHARSFEKGKSISSILHMPRDHSFYSEWSPEKIRHWSEKEAEPTTIRFINKLLEDRSHLEQAYRGSIGILALIKKYGSNRVETACIKAIEAGAIRYKTVKKILERNRDKILIFEEKEESVKSINHENIRGNNYYKTGGR